MAEYAQGKYTLKNPEKYMANRQPTYRSSWEFAFMRFCDEHPSVEKWASEAVKIPYRNPFTGKQTIYCYGHVAMLCLFVCFYDLCLCVLIRFYVHRLTMRRSLLVDESRWSQTKELLGADLNQNQLKSLSLALDDSNPVVLIQGFVQASKRVMVLSLIVCCFFSFLPDVY